MASPSDLAAARAAHAAACATFLRVRDAEWTADKATRVAIARAECNRLNREANRLWIELNCAKAEA